MIKYVSPKIAVTIQKEWQGGDQIIPDTLDIVLTRNGETIQNITLIQIRWLEDSGIRPR